MNWLRHLLHIPLLHALQRAVGRVTENARERMRERRTRKLQLKESLSLGDKRFVALVAVGEQEFLIGGTATSLTMLSRLQRSSGRKEFERLLARCETRVM